MLVPNRGLQRRIAFRRLGVFGLRSSDPTSCASKGSGYRLDTHDVYTCTGLRRAGEWPRLRSRLRADRRPRRVQLLRVHHTNPPLHTRGLKATRGRALLPVSATKVTTYASCSAAKRPPLALKTEAKGISNCDGFPVHDTASTSRARVAATYSRHRSRCKS